MPVTKIWFPTRTAREYPTTGSQGVDVEKFCLIRTRVPRPKKWGYSIAMPFKKLMMVAALAAASLFAQGTGDDDRIYDQVRLKLAEDRDVKGGGIDVVVKNGVVTLQGKVQTDKQKSKADHVARKVKGVTKVVNNLKVELP